MLHYLLLLTLSTSEYSARQANQDSLLIYNAYKAGDKILENTTQPQRWQAIQDSVLKITAGAFMRLSKYNGASYDPADEYNREGVGAAFVYPEPSEFEEPEQTAPDAAPQANAPYAPPNESKQVAFKVLDQQTHFLTGSNGKTRIPYVTMSYYARGRILVRTEKLNPVTFEPIETELPVTASTN